MTSWVVVSTKAPFALEYIYQEWAEGLLLHQTIDQGERLGAQKVPDPIAPGSKVDLFAVPKHIIIFSSATILNLMI
jgi:hypothetical protein